MAVTILASLALTALFMATRYAIMVGTKAAGDACKRVNL